MNSATTLNAKTPRRKDTEGQALERAAQPSRVPRHVERAAETRAVLFAALRPCALALNFAHRN